jgi:hypothetical protein
VIGLIYRIVDEPRRVLTLVSMLLPVLAVIVQVSAARATVAKIPRSSDLVDGNSAMGNLLVDRPARCQMQVRQEPTAHGRRQPDNGAPHVTDGHPSTPEDR